MLNVNQTAFNPALANPTSIKMITNTSYSLEKLFNNILLELDQLYDTLSNKKNEVLKKEYEASLYKINQKSAFVYNGKHINGIILGVNQDGMLNLKLKNEVLDVKTEEIHFIHS